MTPGLEAVHGGLVGILMQHPEVKDWPVIRETTEDEPLCHNVVNNVRLDQEAKRVVLFTSEEPINVDAEN